MEVFSFCDTYPDHQLAYLPCSHKPLNLIPEPGLGACQEYVGQAGTGEAHIGAGPGK